jgi:hypothetical protein
MLLSKEHVVDERSKAITDERSRECSKRSVYLSSGCPLRIQPGRRTRRERRKEQRSLCVLSLATTTSDSRKKDGTTGSFYTEQIVGHGWRLVETMGAIDHHCEPFADRERSLNMTLPSSETASFRLVSPASSAFQADRDDTQRRRRRPNAFAKQAVVDQLDHHRPGQVEGNRVNRPVRRYCL